MTSVKPEYPKVYFRVDHGEMIGDGHLFRDKALADKFKEYGFDPVFISRARDGFDEKKFSPHNVIILKNINKKINSSSSYQDWLGVTEKDDVEECLMMISFSKGNIWIVDHYGIGQEWEKEMIESGQIVIAIDDLFHSHYSHLILNHNLTADSARYKINYVNTHLLMGPQYALLRDDICKSEEYKFSNEKKSHLLFLGGAEEDLFYKILTILRQFNLEQLILLNPPENFKANKNEIILSFCSDLPNLYMKQKMVFGSCGVAHLERMALGVPTATCVVADNQIEVGAKIDELGVSFHLGDLRTLSDNELRKKISVVLQNSDMLKEKVMTAKNIISKNGTEKVVKEVQNKLKEWQSR